MPIVGSALDVVLFPAWLTSDVIANGVLAPMLFFLYPFVGLQLLLGDKHQKLRERMMPDHETHGLYDRLVGWSYHLIFEALSILKIFGFEPKGAHAIEIPAFKLAMAYGLQWAFLLPNFVIFYGSVAIILFHK